MARAIATVQVVRMRIASTALGVRRGRLPGATDDACAGSAQLCDPRDDGHRPVPGMTGVS